jgi:hypothetical protein
LLIYKEDICSKAEYNFKLWRYKYISMKEADQNILEKIGFRLVLLFFLLFNFAFLFKISYFRQNFFYEHIENLSLNRIILVLVAFLGLLLGYGLLFFEKKSRLNRKEIAVIILIFIFILITPPFLSRDVGAYLIGARNFIWFHANAYLTNLNGVAGNSWLGELGDVWWLNYPYPYGPVFLAIASLSVLPNFAHLIGAVYFYKLIVFLAYILSVIIFAKITKILSLDKFLIFLFALNPAILVNGAMEGHNEIFVVLFLLAAVYSIVRGKNGKGYSFWLASVFVKYNALIFLPIFWKKKDKFSIKRMLFSGTGAASALVLTIIVFFRRDAGNFIHNAGIMKSQLQNCLYLCSPAASIFDLMAGRFSGLVRLILFSLIYFFLLFRFLLRGDNFLKFMFWSFLAIVFVLTMWISPWYVLTVIPVGLLIDEKKYRAFVFVLTAYSLLHFFSLF